MATADGGGLAKLSQLRAHLMPNENVHHRRRSDLALSRSSSSFVIPCSSFESSDRRRSSSSSTGARGSQEISAPLSWIQCTSPTPHRWQKAGQGPCRLGNQLTSRPLADEAENRSILVLPKPLPFARRGAPERARASAGGEPAPSSGKGGE
eukprot:COSAG04_NODE_10910_length_744_cov_1.502326_2_plen_150_part_01